ncbi:YihY/virulence factor BrkB family protein [Deminuibacter soli]|uniref:YihY/virulence factor BrkB family protein n=1 Tax=Deminuibacter soli TaxID=2291815 RepID=A0A3E1NED1_9BACT|nr:YihY/virulence factor BrkB family protein [Deminuibacter soli]RFM26329.1 YihY/virulence factor BrkB family protein [Deminuibacter soli]
MKNIFTKQAFGKGWKLLTASFSGFSKDNGFKLSASLAYSTIFSLGPLLLLMMSLASIFFGQDAIEGRVFQQLNDLIGAGAAKQVQDIIRNIQFSGKTHMALITSIIILIVGATSLFIEIQDSLNIIWRVRAKPKKGWLKFLQNRLLSSSMIISLGFLLVASLIVNGLVDALSAILSRYISDVAVVLMSIINMLITFIVIALLFGIMFKFLPDVKIKWRDVRTGALVTAVFFMLGRYLIGLYISTTGTGSTYGAAGSIIILLVWIYYTAVIFYLGAEFTQVYSETYGTRIQPADYAVHVEQHEIEHDVNTLPLQHPELKEQK